MSEIVFIGEEAEEARRLIALCWLTGEDPETVVCQSIREALARETAKRATSGLE